MGQKDMGTKQPRQSGGPASSPSVPHALQKEPKTALRDNLESLAIWILLLLLARQLVGEAFKIPTGSMAPTLLGEHRELRCPNCNWVFSLGASGALRQREAECPNCHFRLLASGGSIRFKEPAWLWHMGRSESTSTLYTGTAAANRVIRGGSRILVNKLVYRLRKPRRWEVMVFLYPFQKVICSNCNWSKEVRYAPRPRCPDCGSEDLQVQQKNFVKRVVGLPGEKVQILSGDVYINGHIARKPPAIQQRMWQHVYDSRYVPKRKLGPIWDFGRLADLWEQKEGGEVLVVNAVESAEPVLVDFVRKVTDSSGYNGRAGSPYGVVLRYRGPHEVDDCRIGARLKVLDVGSGGGAAVLRIAEAGRTFLMRVPVGGPGQLVLTENGRVVGEVRVEGLKAGETASAALESYDRRVVARLRGESLLSYEFQRSPAAQTFSARPGFGAAGADVEFGRVVIQRDVYYLAVEDSRNVPRVYNLEEDQYFVLGDNSSESSDSRHWDSPEVPAENIVGQAFFVFWPIQEFRRLSLGAVSVPSPGVK